MGFCNLLDGFIKKFSKIAEAFEPAHQEKTDHLFWIAEYENTFRELKTGAYDRIKNSRFLRRHVWESGATENAVYSASLMEKKSLSSFHGYV